MDGTSSNMWEQSQHSQHVMNNESINPDGAFLPSFADSRSLPIVSPKVPFSRYSNKRTLSNMNLDANFNNTFLSSDDITMVDADISAEKMCRRVIHLQPKS